MAQDVNVRGYTRRDGVYVRPHVRTAPDGITSNNRSVRTRAYPAIRAPRSSSLGRRR